MVDNGRPSGQFGAILGGLVALAAVAFLLSGGNFTGKKTVESDRDLPPVTTSGR